MKMGSLPRKILFIFGLVWFCICNLPSYTIHNEDLESEQLVKDRSNERTEDIGEIAVSGKNDGYDDEGI